MAAVDLRYARALEAVVSEQNLQRHEVLQQLEDFVTSLNGSPQLREVLGDPSISQESKLRVLDALSQRLGMSLTVRNFIAVVTAHERLYELREMIDAFSQLSDKDAGIAEALVTSARPMDDIRRRALEQSIAQITGHTQIRATYQEDPGLLGGAVIKVGSTVYDGSVRGQLEQMKQRLVSATA